MKRGLVYTVLSAITVSSIIFSVYLYIEYKDSRSSISILRKQNELMNLQIETRNTVLDKTLGTNINDPLSLSENYERVKKEHRGSKETGLNVITSDMEKEIILPLYTPDGHYFGEISYAAYSAIVYDKLQEYDSLNDEEMHILHSYMNYITLNPGMSLVKY